MDEIHGIKSTCYHLILRKLDLPPPTPMYCCMWVLPLQVLSRVLLMVLLTILLCN